MILQYRNHPSIVLWGVRINESQDDDEFYTATNKIAHELDVTQEEAMENMRRMIRESKNGQSGIGA